MEPIFYKLSKAIDEGESKRKYSTLITTIP
jgi:hypothetical protein